MKKTEKEKLMETVFGKNAKRRTIDASDFMKTMENETQRLNTLLKQQSDQLSEMMKESSFTDADYEKLKQEIEKDFNVTLSENQTIVPIGNKKMMSSQDCEELIQSLQKEFIGQDAFVVALCHSVRKAFVMGSEDTEAMFKVCLCGNANTMKREILAALIQKMTQLGYFSTNDLPVIDLRRYESLENETQFVQDVYAALSKSKVIVFDHLHQVEPMYLSLLQTILSTSKLPLKKRYVSIKGQLQEASTTLTTHLIDHLSFSGKGIVVCADVTESKLREQTGTQVLKWFDDVIETSSYTTEALTEISKLKLSQFQKKCEAMNLVVTYDESCIHELIQQVRKETGLKGMEEILESWMKALVQMKVQQHLEQIVQLHLLVEDGALKAQFDQQSTVLTEDENQAFVKMEKEVLDELNEIVGLDEIKQYVLSLKDHYRIQKLRATKGMKINSVSMHMIFTGNPGTGKTTIARLISRYLKAIGVLESGQLVEVTRADLVGRYVGHTAPQCEKVIESALGGVLFIDEAYSLYRGKDDSFGLEAIDALVKGMEDHRDHLLVILAGYSKEMKEFLTSNSGLKSRFPNVIEFPDYTAQQLLLITKSIAKSKQYVLHKDCDEILLKYYEQVQKTSAQVAGNGRLARNLVEAAILKQSSRCLVDESAALDELKAEDFELKEVS